MTGNLERLVDACATSLRTQYSEQSNPSSLTRTYDAQDVARGIQASGLGDRLSADLERLGGSVVGAATLLEVQLHDIAWGISTSNARLKGIEQALRSPRGVAAAERVQRGSRALRNDWLPEAEEEFESALLLDPYDASSHVLLAMTLIRRPPANIDRVERCLQAAFRYGTPEQPHIATFAALMNARLRVERSDEAAAIEIVQRAERAFPTCAEVVALHAQLTNDPDRLLGALWLSPTLVWSALLGFPDLLQAAAERSAMKQPEITEVAHDLASTARSVFARLQIDLALEELDVAYESATERLTAACALRSRAGSLGSELQRLIGEVSTTRFARLENLESQVAVYQRKIRDVRQEIGKAKSALHNLSAASSAPVSESRLFGSRSAEISSVVEALQAKTRDLDIRIKEAKASSARLFMSSSKRQEILSEVYALERERKTAGFQLQSNLASLEREREADRRASAQRLVQDTQRMRRAASGIRDKQSGLRALIARKESELADLQVQLDLSRSRQDEALQSPGLRLTQADVQECLVALSQAVERAAPRRRIIPLEPSVRG